MKHSYFEIDKHGNLKKTNKPSDSEGGTLKKKQERKKSFFNDYININVGYSLVTPILLGVIIGLTLDSRFHSKPVFTVFFIFLGTISSFYNLFKLIK